MSNAVLSIDGVTGGYGRVTVLRDVSLEVQDREIVALLGGNGGGKSTLLKTIAGLLTPTAGDVRLNGESLLGKTPEAVARAGIVLVPEGRQLFSTMTARENLMLGAYLHRRNRKQLRSGLDRVLELFPALREKLTVQCQNLSGGQQQMVAIGRALMAQPSVLLLDEPSLGLAPMVLKEVFDAIAALRLAGVTVLIIEQNAVMTLKLADRGYVLVRGAVTMSDTAENLLQDTRVAETYLGAAYTPTATTPRGEEGQ